MTITTKGVDANGRPINNVRVYDKQWRREELHGV
jgi:hypothetical protein